MFVTRARLVELVNNFCEALDLFRTSFEDKWTSDDDKFAWQWLKDRVPSSKDVLVQDVIYEVAGRTHSPRYSNLLLITPNTGRTTGIVALFWAYMSGTEKITVKPGKNDNWTREFVEFLPGTVTLYEDFPREESELGRALFPFDAVIVYGSQKTIDLIESAHLSWRVEPRVIAYGPKMSVAVHDSVHFTEEDIDNYLRDIVTYDGLGCLNTSILYVTSWNTEIIRGLQSLSSVLLYKAKEAPILTSSWLVDQIYEEGFISKYDSTIFRTVRRASKSLPVGFGTLHVVPIKSPEELLFEFPAEDRHLLSSATVKVTGPEQFYISSKSRKWKHALHKAGVTRFTHPGYAQDPSLNWANGGRSLLNELVNLIDGE